MTNILDFTKFLPEEVIFAIFDKLTAKDLCIAARVNSEVIYLKCDDLIRYLVEEIL